MENGEDEKPANLEVLLDEMHYVLSFAQRRPGAATVIGIFLILLAIIAALAYKGPIDRPIFFLLALLCEGVAIVIALAVALLPDMSR